MRCAAALIVSTGPIEHRWLAREAPDEAPRGPKLLERVREALRVRHYSWRTEKAYVGWVRRYILFHGKRHPREMGPEEVTRFLTWLAVDAKVSASTQNQALAALLFLYGEVLGLRLPWLDDLVRASRPPRTSTSTRARSSSVIHGRPWRSGCDTRTCRSLVGPLATA